MDSFKNSLGYWSSILATAIALLGVFESLRWLVALGLLLMAVSVAATLYAWKERRRLKMAVVTIAGRRIDALNLANLERRLNRTLFVQELDQVATVNGEDVTIAWRYSGYCRAAHETSVEFSIDMDNHIPFDHLDCVAYDLRNDPHQMHGIRPVLLGADGLSKKIAVPLLERLSAGDPFSVHLVCSIPGCMKSGIEYYTSTTSVKGSRRCERVEVLLNLVANGKWDGMKVRLISLKAVRGLGTLPAMGTKYGRASFFAERFPELRAFLPPVRKIWMSEDHRMCIFDALGLALVCLPRLISPADIKEEPSIRPLLPLPPVE